MKCDFKGLIALTAVGGTFLLAGLNLYLTGGMDVAPWAAMLVGSIAGYYYGYKNGNGNGAAKSP